MRSKGGVVVIAVGALLLAPLGCRAGLVNAPAAEENSNPYFVIAEKNVFRLSPPPLPPPVTNTPPPNLAQVFLTGFMRTGEQWKAFLAAKTQSPNPQEHELFTYLALTEGEKQTVGSGDKQGVVELVRIYGDQEKVDIINSGTPVTLSIEGNGIKGQVDNGVKTAAAANAGFFGSRLTSRARPMSRAMAAMQEEYLKRHAQDANPANPPPTPNPAAGPPSLDAANSATNDASNNPPPPVVEPTDSPAQ